MQYNVNNKLFHRLLPRIKVHSSLIMSTCVAVMKLNNFLESSRIYNNYFVITSSCLSLWNHYVSLVTLGPTAHAVSLMTSSCLFQFIESRKAPKTIPYRWSCLGLSIGLDLNLSQWSCLGFFILLTFCGLYQDFVARFWKSRGSVCLSILMDV